MVMPDRPESRREEGAVARWFRVVVDGWARTGGIGRLVVVAMMLSAGLCLVVAMVVFGLALRASPDAIRPERPDGRHAAAASSRREGLEVLPAPFVRAPFDDEVVHGPSSAREPAPRRSDDSEPVSRPDWRLPRIGVLAPPLAPSSRPAPVVVRRRPRASIAIVAVRPSSPSRRRLWSPPAVSRSPADVVPMAPTIVLPQALKP